MGKSKVTKIVIACDGTWQSAATGNVDNPTNVSDFCRALSTHGSTKGKRKKYQQIVFYQPGVGSGALSKLERIIAGSTGQGLEENARDAYVFLTDNYTKGDEIYLFGFSRGAYTARTVAAFIGSVGVLSVKGIPFFKPLYELYKQAQSSPEWEQSLTEYIQKNNLDSIAWRTPPKDVIIKVVGCWETVGSLGIPHSQLTDWLGVNDKFRFLNMQLPARVEHAFHALALDEHRASFYPTIWWLDPKAQSIPDIYGKPGVKPELIQCWFPGHHNDVGGNAKNRKIADLALAWIVDQCHKNGLLEFHVDFLKSILEPTRNSPHESWKESTHDPFYAGFLPSKLWAFMGERVRQPGHEPLPKGWFPATKTSKTYEYIHYSVREKADEIGLQTYRGASDCDDCQKSDPAPSRALEGFKYSPLDKAWIKRNAKGKIVRLLPEFPRPASNDPDSLQAYLSSDWLKLAEHFGDVKDASIKAHNDYVEQQAVHMKDGGISDKLKDIENSFEDGLNKGVDKVEEALKDGGKRLKDGAKTGFDKLKDGERKVQDGVMSSVKNGMEKLKDGEKKAEKFAKTGVDKLKDGEKKVEDLAKDEIEKVKEAVTGGKKSKRREKFKLVENSRDGEEDNEAECVSKGCRDRRRAAKSKSKNDEESRSSGGKLKEGETGKSMAIMTSGPSVFENADARGFSSFMKETEPQVSQSNSHSGHFNWKTGNWSLTTTKTVRKEWRPSK